jgi:uncharacterized RDD family membrane protein YckC
MGTMHPFFLFAITPIYLALYVLTPVLYFAIPTGIWGRTPGKFILRLKVSDYRRRPPGILRALGRETLKLLSFACPLGILLNMFQLFYTGSVWYDDLCGTDVEHNPYVRLTQTQKNWRKLMKDDFR